MTVTAENLGKRFSREWIFRNLNYTFQDGTFAVTGPNGSGKSTLLKVLWGQVPPSSGAVRYHAGGNEIPQDEVYKHLTIVAPYMELIEELTVRETISFHFSFKKARESKGVEEVLELCEMAHVRSRLVNQLSSGMKQRLKLGLAFFTESPLLFMDEPTSNLDRKSIEWYWRHLTSLEGKCTIFVASNLENEYPATAKKIHVPEFR